MRAIVLKKPEKTPNSAITFLRAFLFLSVFFLLDLQADDSLRNREIKLLVLITASDDLPVYENEQKIWRSYMHLDPLHVQAFFMKANPDLASACELQGDIIWCRTVDALIPAALNKTILSLEFLSSKIHEFDYVLRTNLSSFYFFPRLLEFLKTLPPRRCYCARQILRGTDEQGEFYFGSGAGFILSQDLACRLVQAKSQFLNRYEYDDVAIGAFFRHHGIPLIPTSYIELPSVQAWIENQEFIPDDAFHFRCKNETPHLRARDEIFVLEELLHRFYEIES